MKLTVILANTFPTEISLIYENEWQPYRRRTVQIELTPEQIEKITPQKVGERRGEDVYEILLQSWLEG